ncbi:hypothetical protein [Bradyrhizobium sp.]|uniref:hypothetical protein n=1 Tax=Bradyrhizobium sp. TaxID=376 RepID=UPI0025C25A3A|nr:hypothetical protein [Bradyrhizobium sp.]
MESALNPFAKFDFSSTNFFIPATGARTRREIEPQLIRRSGVITEDDPKAPPYLAPLSIRFFGEKTFARRRELIAPVPRAAFPRAMSTAGVLQIAADLLHRRISTALGT